MTVERHIGGRRYLTEVPVGGDLSLREVAAFLNVDPATVWRWVRAKKLVGRKERGQLRVPVREIFRFERREFGPWLTG
jgi:transposase